MDARNEIRTFMQMKLEACRDELDWLIRCHNCAPCNCPEEEYPPKPLHIPPDYIENVQSRLGKVMKGILPPTLNIILKTHYQAPVHPQQQGISPCSQEEQLKTSLEMKPDNMTGRHQDGEHNLLDRPKASAKAEKVVADGTSHVDQGGYFVFQTEVGMNLETPQVTARQFSRLPIDRQQ